MVWIGDLEDEVDNPGINYFLDLTADWLDNEKDSWFTPKTREAYLLDVEESNGFMFLTPLYYSFLAT